MNDIQGAKAPASHSIPMSEEEREQIALRLAMREREQAEELKRWLKRGGVDVKCCPDDAVKKQLANRSRRDSK